MTGLMRNEHRSLLAGPIGNHVNHGKPGLRDLPFLPIDDIWFHRIEIAGKPVHFGGHANFAPAVRGAVAWALSFGWGAPPPPC